MNTDHPLVNLQDFETAARAALPPLAFDFFAGGSGDEQTLRANRDAWERVRLRPRVLVDVSARDLSTTVLGQPVSLPVLIAPCGLSGMAHPEGECAVTRAAAAAGTIHIVSTAATRSLEEVAETCAGRRWFQLYCYRDREITRALIQRAEVAGYQALCVTVDAPLLGRRERDERNHFSLPAGLSMKNLEAYRRDRLAAGGTGSALSRYGSAALDSTLTWELLAWMRGVTGLPIVLKGILTAEDARLAVAHGVEAIVVSNHGGRQLDGAVSTCEALPEVVDAAAGRLEVLVDGGIRRGSDVLKALALGARAVLIGRPYLWGLAVGGAEGVGQVLELLRAELDNCMALAGRPTIGSIDRSLIRLS